VEIYEKDLIILMESGERIKEAFLKCAEKSLVFPFIPFRDLKIDEIFKSGWIKKTCFGFPFSHFIGGFEIITKVFRKNKIWWKNIQNKYRFLHNKHILWIKRIRNSENYKPKN